MERRSCPKRASQQHCRQRCALFILMLAASRAADDPPLVKNIAAGHDLIRHDDSSPVIFVKIEAAQLCRSGD